MRQFESMLDELQVAGWVATQGNRTSIGSELVEADQMGGSIKKAQIGHFILSIAKTLIQREDNSATMAILKSRFGQSGIVFRNCIFNNGTVQIETGDDDNGMSYSKVKEVKEKAEKERLTETRIAIQARKGKLDEVKPPNLNEESSETTND